VRSEAADRWAHTTNGSVARLEHQIGRPCSPEERHVELAPDKSIREVGRILARDGDLDIGEFVPAEARIASGSQSISFRSGSQRERQSGGPSSASGRFASRIDLSQRQSGMVENARPAAVNSMPVSTADHQLRATSYSDPGILTTDEGWPCGSLRSAATVRLPSSATATNSGGVVAP